LTAVPRKQGKSTVVFFREKWLKRWNLGEAMVGEMERAITNTSAVVILVISGRPERTI
jgi:hypothetical protein